MSVSYPQYPNSSFPENVDNWERQQDLNASDIPLMRQYQGYIDSGNITLAQQVLEDNPHLKNKIISADKMNNITDGLKTVQKFFKDNVNGYIDTKQQEMQDYVDVKTTELTTKQTTSINTMETKKQEMLNEVGKFSYKGIYSKITQYYKWNTVKFRGNVYLCIADVLGSDPTNELYWLKIADNGDKVNWRGTWTQVGEYKHLDMVTYNNDLYVCKLDNYNKNPELETVFWEVILTNKNNDKNHYVNYKNGRFTLNHNLGEFPLVQAIVQVSYGHSGYGMFGVNNTYQLDNIVEYIDANSMKIHFAEEFKGTPTVTQTKPREFTITYSNETYPIKLILR